MNPLLKPVKEEYHDHHPLVQAPVMALQSLPGRWRGCLIVCHHPFFSRLTTWSMIQTQIKLFPGAEQTTVVLCGILRHSLRFFFLSTSNTTISPALSVSLIPMVSGRWILIDGNLLVRDS